VILVALALLLSPLLLIFYLAYLAIKRGSEMGDRLLQNTIDFPDRVILYTRKVGAWFEKPAGTLIRSDQACCLANSLKIPFWIASLFVICKTTPANDRITYGKSYNRLESDKTGLHIPINSPGLTLQT